jgi:hypothetical protein
MTIPRASCWSAARLALSLLALAACGSDPPATGGQGGTSGSGANTGGAGGSAGRGGASGATGGSSGAGGSSAMHRP